MLVAKAAVVMLAAKAATAVLVAKAAKAVLVAKVAPAQAECINGLRECTDVGDSTNALTVDGDTAVSISCALNPETEQFACRECDPQNDPHAYSLSNVLVPPSRATAVRLALPSIRIARTPQCPELPCHGQCRDSVRGYSEEPEEDM